ncbi:BGP_1a_G0010630.mRNA.1.CDS.1 [Saccharomyces cerevisiae]|nr:BGP_1a_G0010630.mRNA.1.CDS.1 [Saccharomyces cerevisiae]CAI7074906.1 BGP_1a_G0010630.mRNA.1.CDS.1 [Saccharomyces cerevisiae]
MEDTSRCIDDVLEIGQQEKEIRQAEFSDAQGEREEVKCIDYTVDLEAGLPRHESSGKSNTLKQCYNAVLGFLEELIIVIIIVLLSYSLTMVGLFYVMTMTKFLF